MLLDQYHRSPCRQMNVGTEVEQMDNDLAQRLGLLDVYDGRRGRIMVSHDRRSP